ncbi:hypothetical protein C8F04DRAFT_1084357 [Mycena alexandri]|uniref:Uncharacterized protein n=1 Tax=Mycena alexandri TaxID=1745969 RepID=A0AAD6T8X5_9AGAR|nr:hypothetical protein C8F04DRAFT_1084357 [Mycena alexandri]
MSFSVAARCCSPNIVKNHPTSSAVSRQQCRQSWPLICSIVVLTLSRARSGRHGASNDRRLRDAIRRRRLLGIPLAAPVASSRAHAVAISLASPGLLRSLALCTRGTAAVAERTCYSMPVCVRPAVAYAHHTSHIAPVVYMACSLIGGMVAVSGCPATPLISRCVRGAAIFIIFFVVAVADDVEAI